MRSTVELFAALPSVIFGLLGAHNHCAAHAPAFGAPLSAKGSCRPRLYSGFFHGAAHHCNHYRGCCEGCRIGRGDLSCSSIPTYASTGVSDERGWSVRSNSKSIGPTDFNIGRGDHQHTWIKGSPPTPTLHSVEIVVGPIDRTRDRPGPVLEQEGALVSGKFPARDLQREPHFPGSLSHVLEFPEGRFPGPHPQAAVGVHEHGFRPEDLDALLNPLFDLCNRLHRLCT